MLLYPFGRGEKSRTFLFCILGRGQGNNRHQRRTVYAETLFVANLLNALGYGIGENKCCKNCGKDIKRHKYMLLLVSTDVKSGSAHTEEVNA